LVMGGKRATDPSIRKKCGAVHESRSLSKEETNHGGGIRERRRRERGDIIMMKVQERLHKMGSCLGSRGKKKTGPSIGR